MLQRLSPTDTFEAPNLEGGIEGSALVREKEPCKTMLGEIAGELYIWRLQRNAASLNKGGSMSKSEHLILLFELAFFLSLTPPSLPSSLFSLYFFLWI